jgi:hypothetical protein
MIPAILKTASWAQRGMSAGVIAGVVLAVFGWGYLKGVLACQQAQAETVLDQSMDATRYTEAKADALATVDGKHDRISHQSAQQAQVIHDEVIKYVAVTTPCPLGPRSVDLLARIQQLQREAENRVSEAHATEFRLTELQTHQATTNQLLQSYTELADARRLDLELIDRVKDWDRARYEAELSFYEHHNLTRNDDE